MSKQLSLYALLALVVVAGVLVYRVVQPFAVALFIAIVLAVLFEPIYRRLTRFLGGRYRIAAGISTACVFLLLVMPVGGVLLLASSQLADTTRHAVDLFERWDSGDLEKTLDNLENHPLGRRLERAYRNLAPIQQSKLREAVSGLSDGIATEVYRNTRGMVGDVFHALVSFAIMALGLYYFLADGEAFLNELHRLLPLGRGEERRLFAQFQLVCRGVVLGTIVAGLVQATLAGVAFAMVGVEHLWLLVVLTMFCSFIPFVGAIAVWAPVTLALLMDNQPANAIGLGLFGLLVISTSDNLVRAYIIGGEAKLHPLVALVSVLGALKLIGLWGIFIGPMVAAFFYALAQIFRERVQAALHESEHSQDNQ